MTPWFALMAWCVRKLTINLCRKLPASMEMTARDSVPNSGWYPDQSPLFKAPAVVALELQDNLLA